MTHPDLLFKIDLLTRMAGELSKAAESVFEHLAALKLCEPTENDTEDVAEWADDLRCGLAAIAEHLAALKTDHHLAGSST